MHLEPEKATALEALADTIGRKQSELMREAIDDLLKKYRRAKKRKP
jgi:predicted DNA-binding protein